VVGAGPPTTVRFPIALARRITVRIDSECTSIPETSTASAQARSASSSGARCRSTMRTSQRDGRSAASVARPSGGRAAPLPVYGSAKW